MDKNEINHIAKLSRLKFDDSCVNDITKDMNNILKWMEVLQSVDVSNVDNIKEETIPLRQRDDIVTIGNIADELIKNTKEPYENFFTVPKVVE